MFDEQGVDLDELTWERRPEALRQAPCMSLLIGQAKAPAAGFAAQHWHWGDDAAIDEAGENTSDGRDGDGKAFALEQDGELAFSPHGIVETQLLDRLDECW